MIGFLNVYKPSGITSNAVVQKIKHRFKIKKIGHTGTLDPMACGILPIAIGKATRLFDYALEKTKKYIAIFDFSYETETLDADGETINTTDKVVSMSDINLVLQKMIGKQMQIPPKFSAKNIGGKRAYDLARDGVNFELPPKEIEIFDINLIKQVDLYKFQFEITCSSGTYIRSIGRDLAKLLGTIATMTFLERTETGNFNSLTAINLDTVLESENIENLLISPMDVFEHYKKLELTTQMYTDLINGKFVSGVIKSNTFLTYKGNLIGVAKPNEKQIKIDTYLEDKE